MFSNMSLKCIKVYLYCWKSFSEISIVQVIQALELYMKKNKERRSRAALRNIVQSYHINAPNLVKIEISLVKKVSL